MTRLILGDWDGFDASAYLTDSDQQGGPLSYSERIQLYRDGPGLMSFEEQS